MALKLKEITITKKVTINLGDYSNEVIELTLTAESDAKDDENSAADVMEMDTRTNECLLPMVLETVQNRLIAGIPALNGKVGNQRRAALESQPCTKVLATLNPELAKEVVDRALEMSLAPEKKVAPRVDAKLASALDRGLEERDASYMEGTYDTHDIIDPGFSGDR